MLLLWNLLEKERPLLSEHSSLGLIFPKATRRTIDYRKLKVADEVTISLLLKVANSKPCKNEKGLSLDRIEQKFITRASRICCYT